MRPPRNAGFDSGSIMHGFGEFVLEAPLHNINATVIPGFIARPLSSRKKKGTCRGFETMLWQPQQTLLEAAREGLHEAALSKQARAAYLV
mmetsp:Transcript_38272/g.82780  ORF Transcript_38272/g.82780 Transcript_38272/m.82780 type:complete len:90 (+) Transcript_38272:140-409(+)